MDYLFHVLLFLSLASTASSSHVTRSLHVQVKSLLFMAYKVDIQVLVPVRK